MNMDLVIFGLQISAMIIVVVLFVAVLLNIIIAVFIRLDKQLFQKQPAPAKEVESALKEVEEVKEIAIPTPSGDELSAELMAVIVAAAEAATRKKVRIKTIRYRRQPPRSSWVMQGRATLLTSHNKLKR